jgi:menaquinone-specific isochorismate synthase
MDLAFFRLPDGRAWMGEGPFAEAAEPPPGDAFYQNDFSLSDPKPWKIPTRLVALPDQPALSPYVNGSKPAHVLWQKPQTEWFKMAFRRIRKDVLAQRLRKMVPVLTEEGTLSEGHLETLLHRVWQAPKGLWGYARLQDAGGFIGATPELLLQTQGRTLTTMALAGTAKPNGADSFATDTKEIDEHEIVATFLEDTLTPLGKVARSSRQISQAAGLTHFRTDLSVDLKAQPDLNDLVRRLHPTPAVGCLPRDEAAVQKLMEYRRLMKTPDFFGAPFGLKTGNEFHAVVSIRGISWEGNTVHLPSGCGIVGGSAFDHEWRELRLKREAVAHLLGI